MFSIQLTMSERVYLPKASEQKIKEIDGTVTLKTISTIAAKLPELCFSKWLLHAP